MDSENFISSFLSVARLFLIFLGESLICLCHFWNMLRMQEWAMCFDAWLNELPANDRQRDWFGHRIRRLSLGIIYR